MEEGDHCPPAKCPSAWCCNLSQTINRTPPSDVYNVVSHTSYFYPEPSASWGRLGRNFVRLFHFEKTRMMVLAGCERMSSTIRSVVLTVYRSVIDKQTSDIITTIQYCALCSASHAGRITCDNKNKQESCAIAKMTARCALYK